MDEATATLNERRCGMCTACCTGLAVPELNKAERQRCQHMKHGKGCTIYGQEERPTTCNTFLCAWRMGMGKRSDRPDRLGVFIAGATHSKHKFRILHVHEIKQDNAKRGRARRYIEQLIKSAVVVVISPDGRRTIVGGPPAHIELIRADFQLAVLQNTVGEAPSP